MTNEDKAKVTVPGWRCERCGYIWVARNPEKPTRCANTKCRSPYWSRPARKYTRKGDAA